MLMNPTKPSPPKRLPSMNVATYEKLVLKKVVDYAFWESLRKRMLQSDNGKSISVLNTIAEAIHQLNNYRKNSFQRSAMKVLLQHDGLDNIDPLHFVLLQSAVANQRLWSANTEASAKFFLPGVIWEIHEGSLDGEYATHAILELFYQAMTEHRILQFDSSTAKYLSSMQHHPMSWVSSGLQWKDTGINIFRRDFEKYVEYAKYLA